MFNQQLYYGEKKNTKNRKEFKLEVIQNLPETMKELEPKERLEIFVMLMPYALPKSDKISAAFGEPSYWEL
ncbi:MAG: hypothetical protein WDZ80_03180 [Candidatus Paceibacterota bacterium]